MNEHQRNAYRKIRTAAVGRSEGCVTLFKKDVVCVMDCLADMEAKLLAITADRDALRLSLEQERTDAQAHIG